MEGARHLEWKIEARPDEVRVSVQWKGRCVPDGIDDLEPLDQDGVGARLVEELEAKGREVPEGPTQRAITLIDACVGFPPEAKTDLLGTAETLTADE
ncbi:MAG: hypothetical protein ACQEXJ_19330 [Myxococcota bacterium]